MTPLDVLKRLADPVLETSVLITTLFFCLLGWIVVKAGILGLWLLFLVVPAYIGYLVLIIEAKALRRAAPILSTDQFNLAHGMWRLFPVVTVVLWGLAYAAAADRSAVAADLVLLLGALLLPLSLALLAITHAPLESINPVAAVRLLGRLGPAYLWAPLVLFAGVLIVRWLYAIGAADVLVIGFLLYWLTAACAVTGGVVAAIDVRAEIDIDEPVEPPLTEVAAAGERERQAALAHAYAFISRDNRAGGFAHLADYASRCDDPLAAERWFLDAMFRWENRDTALFYAQRHLSHLLDAGHDVEAMKLTARCLRENPRFKPEERDRARALAAAERLGNAEVAASLRA